MTKDDIIRSAWRELEPHLAEQGYELVELEFARQGRHGVLRLFVDREGGVTLDHCQALSQLVSPILDAADFIDGSYMLEVSSPGIDRPLRKPEDFQRFAGERVKLKTETPVEGRKRFRGTLAGFRDGLVQLECDGETYSVHVENVRKANLDR